MGNQIVSTGSYLPELTVANDDLKKFLDTNDEWISSRTGIKSRHIAVNQTTTTLGIRAAEAALKKSGLVPENIDLVICATVTPDDCVPMVAANIKKGLGIVNAAAMDINANCSGFVYAITVADSLMKSCGYHNAIVVGAETLSQMVDWSDRATCVLFGDGAGAVVLSNTGARGILCSHLDCLSDTEEALSCHNKIDGTPFSEYERHEDVKLHMKGRNVMRFAVKAFLDAANNVIDQAGVTFDDVKVIIPHQANLRILQTAAKTLGVDINKFYINIDHTANTSAASIPVALDEAVGKGLIQKGDLVLFAAFGGGLSSGAALVEW